MGAANSPYPGLRPFERDEADIFFGRETHVDAMVDRLAQRHLLAVTGASGSGKSSLVKAGLLDALEIGLLAEAGPVWSIAQLRPGDHPMSKLADSLVLALGGDRYENDVVLRRAALERGPLALVEELSERPLPDRANLLIVADQFEELFRYRDRGLAGREEAEAFVAFLLASAGQRAVPVYAVLTMRSDFFGECAQFEGLAEAVSDAQYLCPRLARGQIAAAIEGPAAVFSGKVEPLLVSRIVNDMGTDPDQLPLMQHALMRLWDEAKARNPAAPMLRLDDYLAADGIKGSLSHHADEILAEITRDQPERTETARRLFCLVTEGEVRRLARVDEVMKVSGAPLAEIASVSDAFRAPGRSLLMPPPDHPLDPETVLDISHESLIRQWQTLKDWVRAEASSAEQYRATERQARRWADGTADLWDRIDLDVALAWRERERPSLPWAARYGGDFALAMRFLDESRNAERRRRLRGRLAIAGAFVVVLSFAGLAVWEWARAEYAVLRATATADDLVFYFAGEFGDVGMPGAMIKEILKRARELQDGLFSENAVPSWGRFSRAAALQRTAELLLERLGDTKGALRTATEARGIWKALLASSPDDTDWQHDLSVTHRTIGSVLYAQSHLDEALAAYNESLDIAKRLAKKNHGIMSSRRDLWQHDLSLSNLGIGDVLMHQGHLDKALVAYNDALAIDEELAQKDPGNAGWQQGLATIDQRIGVVLEAQGHLNDALVPYHRCLAIMTTLAQNYPANSRFQRNLKASQDYIGAVLKAQGHLGDALAAYRDGLAISKRLSQMDFDNVLWQGDLSYSDEVIGGVLLAQGHLDEAVAAYREALVIAKALVQKDPGNAEWQSRLSQDDVNIGYALKAEAHLDEALAAYGDSLAIANALVQKDPSNTEWQRDLAASNEGIGDALKAQGNLEEAVAAYRAGLAIRMALAQRDSGNTKWERDLAASRRRIGGVLVAQSHLDDASTAFRDALAVAKALALKDPSNTEWQRDLAEGNEGIGDVLKAQGHLDEALAAYRESLAVRMTLAEKDPGNLRWQTDLAISLQKVASAGGEPEVNLAEAIAILKRVEATGTLWPEKKELIADFEAALAKVKPQ
jgi:tetratricopeptide (TPR) repeat protein